MNGFRKGRKKGEERRVRAVPPFTLKFMGRVALEGAAAVED
jgi:hypothetical protein